MDAAAAATNMSVDAAAATTGAPEKVANGGGGPDVVVYEQVRPHLIVKAPHASQAVDFYKKAFGAEEIAKSLHPKRKAEQEVPLILHAHLKFGAAEIMVCDEADETGPNVKSPEVTHATTVILHLVTNNVEAAFAKALEAGAKVSEEIADQPWGQRYGKIVDPYGFVWSIATPLSMTPAAATAADGDVPNAAVL